MLYAWICPRHLCRARSLCGRMKAHGGDGRPWIPVTERPVLGSSTTQRRYSRAISVALCSIVLHYMLCCVVLRCVALFIIVLHVLCLRHSTVGLAVFSDVWRVSHYHWLGSSKVELSVNLSPAVVPLYNSTQPHWPG